MYNDTHASHVLNIPFNASTSPMAASLPELPQDLAGCHELIRQLQADSQLATEQLASSELKLREAEARVAHLEAVQVEYRETIATYEETIEQLRADNKLLKRCIFGSRRERYTDDPDQILLFDSQLLESDKEESESEKQEEVTEESPEPASSGQKKRTSKGRQRRVFPEFIPRDEERHPLNEADIPDEMLNDPNARRFFKKIGERLEVTPLQFRVIEQYQEMFVVDQPDETAKVVSAPRPPTLIHSFAGTSLLAYLTTSRFADHLPYFRLEDILGRGGIHIDRSTQWRWMQRVAEGVTPLVRLMWQRVVLGRVLAMDETPVRELGGLGTTLTGYLWAGVGDADHPYDCFFYSSDRRAIRPQDYLAGFQGYLLTDAYIAYERIGKLWPGIINASCWAHGRRKFEQCHHLGATHATHTALGYFRQLFDLEDVYVKLSPAERLAARQEHSKPIVEAFHKWLQQERSRQLPKAKLQGAINYMLNRWESFERFLECGSVPLSNNVAERALKYPILGRKAWLFVGNPTAGETAATLITLTKTCNRLHIDPFAYLQDVYARLPTMSPDELPSLLPDRWLQDHPQHLLPKRVQEAIERAQRAHEERAARRRAA
jgi:transposase